MWSVTDADYLGRAFWGGVGVVIVLELAAQEGRIKYWLGYLLGRLAKKAHAHWIRLRTRKKRGASSSPPSEDFRKERIK